MPQTQTQQYTLSPDYIVSKSRNLVASMSDTVNDISVQALKILDIYLSKLKPTSMDLDENLIDVRDTYVSFTKSEFCRLMGKNHKLKKEQIQEDLDELTKIKLIQDGFTENGRTAYLNMVVFTTARIYFDENRGCDIIEIQCNTNLSRYFLVMVRGQYISYRLKNTLSLKSPSAIRLFQHLLLHSNGSNGKYRIGGTELRQILCIAPNTYEEFKYFNGRIVKKAVIQINEDTEYSVSYSASRDENTGEHEFSFCLSRKTPIEECDSFHRITTSEEIDDDFYKRESEKEIISLSAACEGYFSEDEIRTLRDVCNLTLIQEGKDVSLVEQLMREKYSLLRMQMNKKSIPHPYAYMKRLCRSTD